MTNIILLLLCLLIGLLLQKNKALPKDAHVALNSVILHVPLPAIALLNIPRINWEVSLASLFLVPWIIFLLALSIFPLLGKIFSWDKRTVGCLILTAGLGNTSFVGFPVVEAFFGREAIKYAVFLDQSGSFPIVTVLGIWVATKYSSGSMRAGELVKKVFLFPPFMAFLVAFILGFFNWEAQGMVEDILNKMAVTLTPLALVSVGLQLRFKELAGEFRPLVMGLGYKLLLAPLLIFSTFYFVSLPKMIFDVAVIEAAMAPMITGAIIASSYSLNVRLSGLMVGIGVPLSFLTLIMWYYILM